MRKKKYIDKHRGRQLRYLVNLTFILSFFPSLIYFLTEGNQVQPIYAVFASFIIFIFGIRSSRRLFLSCAALLLLIFGYSVVGVLVNPVSHYTVVINSASYIAPIALVAALHGRLHLISVRSYIFVLFVWGGVGLIQYFPAPIFLKEFLESVGKVLIADRFVAERVVGGEGGRGVSFLMPEPSGSALQITLLFLFPVYLWQLGRLSTRALRISLLIAFLMIIMNASGTAFLLFGITLLAFWMNYEKLKVKTNLVVSFVLIIATLYAHLLISYEADTLSLPRIFEIISWTYRFLGGELDRNLFELSIMIGGHRIYSLLIGYFSIFDNLGAGHGVAGWENKFFLENVQRIIGISPAELDYLSPVIAATDEWKPWSYLSIITFDLGLLGFLSTILLVRELLPNKKRKFGGGKLAVYWMPALIIILFFPPITNPVSWILLLMAKDLDNRLTLNGNPATSGRLAKS